MARILIVDDEENIRETLKEILEYEGYEIEEAADGAAALALIKKFNYECQKWTEWNFLKNQKK